MWWLRKGVDTRPDRKLCEYYELSPYEHNAIEAGECVKEGFVLDFYDQYRPEIVGLGKIGVTGQHKFKAPGYDDNANYCTEL